MLWWIAMIWLEVKVSTETVHISSEWHPIYQVLTQHNYHNIHRQFVLLEQIFNSSLSFRVPDICQSKRAIGTHTRNPFWHNTLACHWSTSFIAVSSSVRLICWALFIGQNWHASFKIALLLFSTISCFQGACINLYVNFLPIYTPIISSQKTLLASVHCLSFHASSVKSPLILWSFPYVTQLDDSGLKQEPPTYRNHPTNLLHRENICCCVITLGASGIILPLFHLRSLHLDV